MNTKEDKALNLLFHSETYPGMIKKEASDIKLILWRNDTLDEYITWSFIESDKCCTVRRVIWKQRVAYNLNDPETFCADAIISKNISIQLSNSFLKLMDDNIGVSKSEIFIDGIEYGIILNDKKLNWSNELQPDCLELSILYRNTIAKLEMIFN